MSKDRPIKSFRLEGERPFKAYNPGIPSVLFPTSSRRYEQQTSLPATVSSIMQHQQLRHRQQVRPNFQTQGLQQTYNDPADYLRTHQQQGQQNALLNIDLTSYDYNDAAMDDTGTHHMRSSQVPPCDPLMHQGEMDLNTSNIGSSHSALPSFIVPNRSILSAAGPFTDQDPLSLLFDNSITLYGNGPSRSMDNTPGSNSRTLLSGQLAQNTSVYPSVTADGINQPGSAMVFTANTGNYSIKQEAYEGNFHASGSPHVSIPKEQREENFGDPKKFNPNSASDYPMPSEDTSMSNDYINNSTPEKNTGEHSKDPTYIEKRRKNNESAKRSREARRTKEELLVLRVIRLEEKNIKLRAEICLLDRELDALRMCIYQCK